MNSESQQTKSSSKQHVLLTGATGFIGRNILPALINEGFEITVCVRSPASLPQEYINKLNVVKLDFSQATSVHDWIDLVANIDVVINATGIIAETGSQSFADIHTNAPVALFKASAEASVTRVVQISAQGADEGATTQYHKSKQAVDAVLSMLSLDWFILRPAIVYGDGAKSMGLFGALSVLPVVPVIGAGDQVMQFVHVDDLVDMVMACLDETNQSQKVIDVVGEPVFTYAGFLKKLGVWFDKISVRTINVPMSLMVAFSRVGRWIGEPALNPESMQMMQQGKAASATMLEKYIKRPTKNLNDWFTENPATQAERWHSRLYLLRPALRFIIALVWIWTGIVSALIYPQQQSYELLAATGISGIFLPLVLYGAALLNLIIGVLTIVAWRVSVIAAVQIILILAYTLIISLALPEFWLHPFGPVLKNIPMLAVIYIWFVLEKEKP